MYCIVSDCLSCVMLCNICQISRMEHLSQIISIFPKDKKINSELIHSFSPPEQNGPGLTFEKSDHLACQSWKPLAFSTNRAWNRQDGQYTTQQIMSIDIHKKEAVFSRSYVRENTN